MEKERQVLVIFPHPDDEAFGVSGTMSRYVDMGVPVTYACLTFGDMGRNLGYPPFATRESLHSIRKKEVEESARLIGLDDLRLLGYRDKTLEFEAPGHLKGVVRDMIDELNPSRIITFYPGYSVHPDHEATAEAVVAAVSEMPAADRPKLQLVAFSNNTLEDLGEPDIIVDIEGYEARKEKIMAAHESQTGPLLRTLAGNTQESEAVRQMWMKNESFYSYDID
ncbi:bacillithiol biosynthesis deacetylase BshB2 [Salinicoccus sp. ID82-1]|uniref:bacillithiol biosynthesis deacetylase BshB2 n=1 Tax=Salinicoccus sp. ID82-1 TaxID=2820269 RepID=UPI001F02075E|nr:bacillithiol biosynthesis deacetylase BshB2 [Salinicoccus sp. ID82-1]MCG1009593.1 bacillithiol biosynthesis deacetylase BshB2 [Salinicoccus sp. ID82-1]